MQRNLIFWLAAVCSMAYGCHFWLAGSFDPFAQSKPLLSWLIALTMFVVGTLIPPGELSRLLERWPVVLGGTCVQYVSMPLLAVGLAHAAGLSGDLLLGMILVGCVPGAMASNVLTLMAGGNVSYSVSLTTLATIVSPLIVPSVLYLAVRVEGVDRLAMAQQAFEGLLLSVVGPVVTGKAAVWLVPRFTEGMQRVGPFVANAVIIWIIAYVVNVNAEQLGLASGALLGALLMLNLLGYAAGWGAGRLMQLPDPMRRALTLEVGMQNAGLGTVLAAELFAQRQLVTLPPAIYTFGCMLTGAILSQLWSQGSSSSRSSSRS